MVHQKINYVLILFLAVLLLAGCKKKSKEYTTVIWEVVNPVTSEPYTNMLVRLYEAKKKNNGIEYDAEQKEATTNFILNEVEPWYLGLQNMRIGSQARSDYRYYSYRRAKHIIVVGDSVTPTTDYGAFIVEPNGKLTLKAGDEIWIDKIHLKQGSIVHIVPGYTECGNTKMMAGGTGITNTTQHNESRLMTKDVDLNKPVEGQDYIIYPNPAEQTVTIKSNNGSIADEVVFYNLQGNKVLQSTPERSITTIDLGNLKSGVYIIRITSEGRMFNKKLVVK